MENLSKYILVVIKVAVYALIGLSVYWGTLLAFFSFWEFFRTFKISPNYFQAVYGLLGLVAWINAWHYITQIKKHGISAMWQRFYSKNKKQAIFTIIGVLGFMILLRLFLHGVIYPSFFTNILSVLALPWMFGENVLFIISINTRRYLPALEVVNGLGWLLSVAFEVVLFYYISRIIFWRPKGWRSKNNH